MKPMMWLVAAIVAPVLRWIVLSTALWLVRMLVPSWEKTLFQKIPADEP